MKLKFNILLLSGVLALSGGMYSCTAGFDNMDPAAVDREEMDRDAYAVSSAMRTLSSYVISTDVNQYQFSDCLLGGNFGRYFGDANPGFNGSNFATFAPSNHWVQAMFNEIIPEVFINYNAIKNATSDSIYIHVANIQKVLALHRVADVYGPIPYSKVGEDGKIETPYDSVEEIYLSMIDQLTKSVDYLTEYQTVNFASGADNIYNGNTIKWIKLANSVKLRLSMRMSEVNPTLAKQYAEEAVNHPVGVMTSNDDSAYRPYAVKNPLYVVAYDYNQGDSKVAADIITYMNGYEDPRRSVMFTPTSSDLATDPPTYAGIRSGVTIPSVPGIAYYSKPNVKGTDKLLWMNAAEVAFLKAEGALRGWNMGGTAESLYDLAITLSFTEKGLSAADATNYVSNSTRTPEAYIDPLNMFSASAAPSNITIKWEAGDTEKNLERIITQKWIAIYPLGIEAWSEYRRTGYPKFMPVLQNNSGGTVSSSRLARRVMYPSEEYTGNKTNVQSAVSNLLKGADNMGTDLWWAKKN